MTATVTEHIRAHMLRSIVDHPSPTQRRTEQQAYAALQGFFDHPRYRELLVHCEARRLMGGYRYEAKRADGSSYEGRAARGKEKPYYERMREKMVLFLETGNLEFLVDVRNYADLEFIYRSHPAAYFASTERYDDESTY